MDGIIGYTGFVGRSLDRQYSFNAKFDSDNISDVSTYHFDTLFCAGAPGSMFEANRNPESDDRNIEVLIKNLKNSKADRLILISTIAVFKSFEKYLDETASNFEVNLAYGRNRRRLEEFCISSFRECHIIRLPSVFGDGLKKNFIFDIMNPLPTLLTQARHADFLDAIGPTLRHSFNTLYRERDGVFEIDRGKLPYLTDRISLEEAALATENAAVSFHHPDSTFQFYNIQRLRADIELAIDAGIQTAHLVPAPLSTGQIYQRLYGAPMPTGIAKVHHEDVGTLYAHLWGGTERYIQTAADTLNDLDIYFQNRYKSV